MKKKLLALLLTICMVLTLTPAAFAANEAVFTDVAEDAWFATEVQWAYENELMKGTGNKLFEPDTYTTRGMIATILWRMEGEQKPAIQNRFTDVKAGTWYTDGMLWANEQEIILGYGDGTCGPERNCTREELAVILYRYAAYKEYDVTAEADLSKYPDADKISDWAAEAMEWAVAKGLIQGMDTGLLAPDGCATRAQTAVILYRMNEKLVEKEPEQHTHSWDAGTVTKEPTCTEKGVKTYKCTCGETKTEDIAATGKHEYGDYVSNGDGTHSRSCNCGDKQTANCELGEFISNEDGTHYRSCAECGYTLTEACEYTGASTKVCKNCAHEVKTILSPKASASENYTMFMAAIQNAEDGDVIYLSDGTYELATVVVIGGKSLSFVGEDGVVIKRMGEQHIFTVQDSVDPESDQKVVFSNMTLDGNNTGKRHAINAKYNVTVDLYDLKIKDTGWSAILLDNGNVYSDEKYYNDTKTIVNAYNVDLEGTGALVSMDALPCTSTSLAHTTYAEFNYDEECTIPEVEVQSINRGYGNLTVNGEPVYPNSYFVEDEDGIIYLKDTENDELTLWKIPANYEGNALVVPEGTTALSSGVFAGTNITTVTIPTTVADFGGTPNEAGTGASGGAFKNSAVTTVILPEGMTEIPAAAFNGAKNLTSVNIPSTVTTIGINALAYTNLSEITIPATVTNIEYGAFRGMAATTVTIEGNPVIANYAFRSCPNLTTVYMLGANVTFSGTSQVVCRSDDGNASGIIIYVGNETVKSALETAQGSANGYTIVVANEVAEGILKHADSKTYEITSKVGLMNLNSVLATADLGEGKGATVNLTTDIDLTGETWTPIDKMWVTFNGNGHTISNLTAGFDSTGRRSGFWGYAGAVTINDLTLEDVTVTGSQAGTFAGSAEGLKINNSYLKGTNTVNYASGVETWNGIGAITGVLTNSTVNVTIAEGATVTLNRGDMTTDVGCTYVDDLTGHIQANGGSVTNNGTITANGSIT